MASVASSKFPWLPILVLFLLDRQALSHSVPDDIEATAVEVGFLWDTPRQENHHSTEAVVNTVHLKSALRLLCFISPPIPAKYEEHKNDIVRWTKNTSGEVKPVNEMKYWSDSLATMAVSIDNITYDAIGTYTCSYGQLSKSILVKVANVDLIKKLKMPSNFEEVQNYATHIHDGTGIQGWNEQTSLLKTNGRTLTCKTPATRTSKPPPTSIHEIRPSDVSVVAALGDGFTSGLGAKATSWGRFFDDYKGISWSIGGTGTLNDTTTIPNILKEFNTTLKGFSTESTYNLNQGEALASSEKLEEQVNKFISNIKKDKSINYLQDWKVLTLWTGMFDLCNICDNPERYSAGNFIKHLMHSLNILKKEVPRLFINLIPPLDVSIVHQLFTKRPTCHILQQNACPCAAKQDAMSRNMVSKAAKNFTILLEKLVASGIYDLDNQFTVVLQPFMTNGPMKNGQLAEELFGVDCLHFNIEGHETAAVSLWNAMLEPLYSKSIVWEVDQLLNCPSKRHPFLATKINSKVVSSGYDEDEDEGTMPPSAAITLSIVLSITVLAVTGFVWRSRKSRHRNDTLRLLSYPHRPRL